MIDMKQTKDITFDGLNIRVVTETGIRENEVGGYYAFVTTFYNLDSYKKTTYKKWLFFGKTVTKVEYSKIGGLLGVNFFSEYRTKEQNKADLKALIKKYRRRLEIESGELI